eukprot:1300448-Rhodomonas_salina.7
MGYFASSLAGSLPTCGQGGAPGALPRYLLLLPPIAFLSPPIPSYPLPVALLARHAMPSTLWMVPSVRARPSLTYPL